MPEASCTYIMVFPLWLVRFLRGRSMWNAVASSNACRFGLAWSELARANSRDKLRACGRTHDCQLSCVMVTWLSDRHGRERCARVRSLTPVVTAEFA